MDMHIHTTATGRITEELFDRIKKGKIRRRKEGKMEGKVTDNQMFTKVHRKKKEKQQEARKAGKYISESLASVCR